MNGNGVTHFAAKTFPIPAQESCWTIEMAKHCGGCNVKLTNSFIVGLFIRDYCENCASKSEISEHDPGAELKKEQEQMQMQHEAEMKLLDGMIKQHQAHLEQRQRIQECEHEKKPLQFTEKKLLDNDPSKLQALEEKLQLQKEIYKSELQKMMAEEEAKVKLRSKEHEQELKQRQAELQLQCDHERKMSELKTANKLSEIGTQLAQTRQEHQLSLQQMEMKHQKKIKEKDEQIKRLQQEQIKIKAELDAEFPDQNVTHMQESELQKMMAEEEAKVKLRSKEHEQELKQRQAELQLQCDHERKMSELKTANKLSEIGTQLAQTRQEHQLSLQQMEMKHQKKIQEKDEQVKRLQQEQVKIKAELDAEFHDQNVTHMRESQRLDREWKQAGEELERKKLTEVRDLTNVLALDKQEFEKEMERERLKIREEIEKEFLDRVTTELEVEKPDGSRLTLRETQPGFVSQLADNLFGSLPTDPPSLCENRDRDTNTFQ